MKNDVRRMVTLLFFMAAPAVFAQEVAAQTSGASMTLGQFFKNGGDLMYVLAAISIFFIANVIYLFATLRSGMTIPRAVFTDVMDKVRAGQLEEARKVCDYKPSPFSSVAIAAIDYAMMAPDADPMMLDATMTGEGSRQATKLQGRSQWLLDIASVSPMVGLLGTVIGMLGAFQGVSDTIASAKPVALAQGVSLALITTIAGLIIAIPAMAFYAWFRRSAARQVANLESASADLLRAIISQRTK